MDLRLSSELSGTPLKAQRTPDDPLFAYPLSWLRRLLPSLASLVHAAVWWKIVVSCLAVLYVSLRLVRGQPLLSSALPHEYTGPHDVGVIDLEHPLEQPLRLSPTLLKSTGLPAFEIKTILLKLYYPVRRGTPETRPRHPWVSGPIALKAAGYARFAGVSSSITRSLLTFILWAVAGSVTIPAKVDAPLLVDPLPESEPSLAAESLDQLVDEGQRDKFPVMVFSHGDTSCRNEYTTFASELASRGYVIAVLEHRDGSGASTIIKMRGREDQSLVHFHHRDLVSDGPMDRTRWKAEQLAMRDAEIAEAVGILRAIDRGQGRALFASNPRNEGRLLHLWKGRLDLSRLTLGGHSLGATSALQALRRARPGPATPFVGGVILDPGKASGPLNADLGVPILVVHSDSWSRTPSLLHGRPHFDTVRDLAEGVRRRARAAWFLTSRGTSHASASDFPLIQPLVTRLATGAASDPRAAVRDYARVTHDFCRLLRGAAHLPAQDGSLLAQGVTHRQYNGSWVRGETETRAAGECAGYAGRWQIHVSPASGGVSGRTTCFLTPTPPPDSTLL